MVRSSYIWKAEPTEVLADWTWSMREVKADPRVLAGGTRRDFN